MRKVDVAVPFSISGSLPRQWRGLTGSGLRLALAARSSELLRSASSLGYVSLVIALARLPRAGAYALARLVAHERYRRHREVLRTRVELTAMQLGASPEEAEEWLRRGFEQRTFDDLECWTLPGSAPRTLSGLVEVHGKEILDAALASGNGAIVYSGHFAGLFSAFATLGLLGYKVTLFRAQRLPNRYNPIERWFYGRRLSWLENAVGYHFLWTQPPNPAIALQAANALKRNEVVFVLMDVWSQAQSVEVEFLGAVANAPTGAYQLAQVARSPILGLRVRRGADPLPLRLQLEPPLDLSAGRNAVVEQQVALLEEEIRLDPANWTAMLFRV